MAVSQKGKGEQDAGEVEKALPAGNLSVRLSPKRMPIVSEAERSQSGVYELARPRSIRLRDVAELKGIVGWCQLDIV